MLFHIVGVGINISYKSGSFVQYCLEGHEKVNNIWQQGFCLKVRRKKQSAKIDKPIPVE